MKPMNEVINYKKVALCNVYEMFFKKYPVSFKVLRFKFWSILSNLVWFVSLVIMDLHHYLLEKMVNVKRHTLKNDDAAPNVS